ncbi:hypothetical protein SZN_13305, partial [Streptomyces zinciresistens K42]
MSPQGPKRVRVNADAEPEVPRQPIRFLSHEDFMLWRDVGLRGLLPVRTPVSPSHPGTRRRSRRSRQRSR